MPSLASLLFHELCVAESRVAHLHTAISIESARPHRSSHPPRESPCNFDVSSFTADEATQIDSPHTRKILCSPSPDDNNTMILQIMSSPGMYAIVDFPLESLTRHTFWSIHQSFKSVDVYVGAWKVVTYFPDSRVGFTRFCGVDF